MSKRKSLGEYIENAKIIHNNKYDYSLSYINFQNCKSKVKIICPIHGVFEQSFDKHILRKQGCPSCSNKIMNTKLFIEKAKKIHGNKYNYSLVNYEKSNRKIKIICSKHGVFEQTPNSHLNGNGCPRCQSELIGNIKRTPYSELINKFKTIHPEYDYSLVDYKNNRTKIKVICPIHGVFTISPTNLLRGQCCKKCANIKQGKSKSKSIEDFIKDSKEIHGDKYDYSLVEYKNNRTKVKIICPKHGVFEQRPYEHIKGANCPNCNISHGEERIATWLNNHNYIINKDYFREYMFKELGKKRYDFYIPSKNLLIEYNGQQHYRLCMYVDTQEKLKEQQNIDLLKKKFAEDKGINFLAIPYTKYDYIETILENKIGSL